VITAGVPIAHGHRHAVIVAAAFAFMQHSLNVLRLRGFDRIQIESADVPPEVDHAIESVGPVRPMRLDESFELVLVAGIQRFEITGKNLAGWSGWEFSGRCRQGQGSRKGKRPRTRGCSACTSMRRTNAISFIMNSREPSRLSPVPSSGDDR
jgi:hypothetical protein